MKNKKLFNLFAIILGTITLFSFSNVQATESVFGDIMPTRSNAQAYMTDTFSNSQIVPITLGISQSEYKTNNGNAYWVIRDINEAYKDIYCLNLNRGFGAPNGNITNLNNTKRYNSEYDLNSIDKTQYENVTGLEIENKNKILWILNNSLTSTESLSVILNAASNNVDIQSIGLLNKDIEDFIKEDMKLNTRESTKITFEDIKMVQQIAIWHYTNNGSIFENTIGAICDSQGRPISGLMSENIDTDGYGTYIWNGKVKQAKLNALYNYFINGAESGSSESVIPSLTLLRTDVKINDSGNSYIVGPFRLMGENIALIKEITVNSNIAYTLLETATSTQGVTNNDFKQVIGEEFYLKVNKSDINEDEKINLELVYTYDSKILTLLSTESDESNTQPVVFVESAEQDDYIEIEIDIPVINITAQKVWNDNNNQDGKRSSSITVQLYKNNISMGNSYKVTLNNTNNWTYTWNNLLDGNYTVKELNTSGNPVSNGGKYNNSYITNYQVNENKTTITNTHVPETIEISGTKTWVDNNNQDGKRPESIVVNLLANGTKIKSVTVTEAEEWKYSFTNLPKYEAGEEIVYTITEDEVTDYTMTINGYDITNTHVPETIEISGIKTWVDNNNQDGKRPESIVVNLLANGTKIKSVTVTEVEEWGYSFTNLPKYEAGKEIVYTITEEIVADYTTTIERYNITNTYTPEVLEKTVTKVWEDGNNSDEIRPSKVEVQLYKTIDSEKTSMGSEYKIELNAENNWEYKWTDLPAKEDGKQIIYTVEEVNVPEGYTVSYSEDTFTITNIHVPEAIAIQILKVDEEGKTINSSEATFEITGQQQLTAQTNNGVLNLDSRKLVNNNFEYIYTIKEKNAPVGYNKVSEELNVKIAGTTKLENGKYKIDTVNITDKDGNELDNTKILAEYDRELNKVVIKIVNTKTTNSYSVKLLKVSEDGTTPISGAWFKIDNGQPTLISENGKEIAAGTLNEEKELNLIYKLEETTAPNGYIKIAGQKEVKINAKVEFKDNDYQIKQVRLLEELEGITISEENNVITIKVENEVEITGKYNVVLRKVDENGNILNGSKFEVDGTEYKLSTGEIEILEYTNLNSANDIDLIYTIKEVEAPEGYQKIEDTTIYIKGKVQKLDNNYKLIRADLFDSEGEIITDESISVKVEGDSIVILVKNNPIPKQLDLSLRKFITKVNDIEYSREPIVDTSTIASTKTATYKHIKQPIPVQKGDIVTYTIRVYNEGEVDGYVEQITDYLPDNLLPITIGTEGIDEEKYAEEMEFNLNWGWINSEDGKSVTTLKTSKSNSDTYSLLEGYENVTDTKLDAYVEGSDKLDYIDVQIKCLVTDNAASNEYLTNIAEISKMCDAQGIEVETDRDSTKLNADITNINDYKKEEAISSTQDSYVEGQEDDDDFEKVVVKEFDLSLRKFITKVNETSYSRVPVVDTSKLGTVVDGKVITTATYNHSKEPVIVKTGDLVTYKIRIYNEGTLDGFANEITDNIPEGLEFMPNSSINISYRWKMLDKEGNETVDVLKAVMIVTDYLSDIDKNNIINAVSETDGVKTLNYKDVEVQFKVVAKAENLKDNLIINEAQISEDSDRDIDSIPDRDEKYDYTTEKNEDDIDYEPIKLQYFDLALRKFVTKVNSIDYNNRYPEIKYNEDGSITYNHTKDPVLVTTNDIVVYTIRIYNEGEKAGYATELVDNLPDGLEFIPDNEINKQYGWKLLDKEGNATEDITKALKASTDYLKEEKIDALVEENGQKVLTYKDVKIAFKVVEPNTSDRILINIAEILNDSDDDIDSTPGNDIITEDDIDREYVKVQYFDLALKKWVIESRVTYEGKTTTTKTGFTEDSDGIAKVDLVASKMKKTNVKFVYNIKVINEGELPGYAYEVKDYIPSGLKFVAEDNKDWKELEDGTVVTDKLKDTLLNPGESAIVEIVLTWKNSTTNLGLKTNYAEISSDSSDDIDSTPDNNNKKEDDIDDAQVILSIKTAGAPTYIGLVFTTVAILAGGIFLIKKYVI